MSFYRRIVFISLALVTVAAAIGGPYAYDEWCGFRRRDLEERCRVARVERRWDDLQTLADRWSQWDASNGEAWMYRAQAANGREDWPAAVNYYWQVPDADEHAIPALIEVSKLAFSRLNTPFKGIEACERILRLDVHAAGAQKQLMGFYATTVQRQKLLQQIHAAIDRQTEPREAYVYYFLLNTIRSKSAIEMTEHWLKDAPDEELFLVANVLNLPDPKSGSMDTPIPNSKDDDPTVLFEKSKLDLVEQLFQRFPHNIELIAYKTEERFTVGDVNGAAELLAQAPEAAGQDSRFWRFKGWLHESNNEIEEAVAAYRHALELHSVDWTTMNRLATVERRQANIAEVERLTKLVERATHIREEIRKLNSIDLVSPKILADLAKFYRDCGDQKVGSALERRLGGAARLN